MATEFQMDPRDREKFGGPEWIPWDLNALDDLPFDQIDKWEQEMGHSVTEIVIKLGRGWSVGVKGVVWLALRVAGVNDLKFAAFNIRTRQVRERKPGGDARPPAPGSSEPSPEGAA